MVNSKFFGVLASFGIVSYTVACDETLYVIARIRMLFNGVKGAL